jgi:hypothetical protein
MSVLHLGFADVSYFHWCQSLSTLFCLSRLEGILF